jgi:hypothetical protein
MPHLCHMRKKTFSVRAVKVFTVLFDMFHVERGLQQSPLRSIRSIRAVCKRVYSPYLDGCVGAQSAQLQAPFVALRQAASSEALEHGKGWIHCKEYAAASRNGWMLDARHVGEGVWYGEFVDLPPSTSPYEITNLQYVWYGEFVDLPASASLSGMSEVTKRACRICTLCPPAQSAVPVS